MDELDTPARAAAAAAEALRTLNRLTTIRWPRSVDRASETLGTVYAIVDEPSQLAYRPPPALRQVAAGLDTPPVANNDTDRADLVARSLAALTDATAAADALARHLDHAEQTIAQLCIDRQLVVVDADARTANSSQNPES